MKKIKKTPKNDKHNEEEVEGDRKFVEALLDISEEHSQKEREEYEEGEQDGAVSNLHVWSIKPYKYFNEVLGEKIRYNKFMIWVLSSFL